MKQSDLETLQDLLRRKERAINQDLSTLQLGDRIHLSLTAQEDARLRRLIQQLEQESRCLLLCEQAQASFIVQVEQRQAELTALDEDQALTQIHDELGGTLDTYLDERDNGFTTMLLLICLELPELFTKQRDALEHVADDDEYGQFTAQQIVYYNLYDLLRASLESAFVIWHQEHRRDE